ncbi:hypothetical protein SAMN05192553_104339 [Cyclobacterium xiamenense]|uniref:Uncharacterized protein n=1 Tax=Cyclobacterium xiamenense TaxID=1297121 RepID=A0A1H6ZE35_9BACT|nr:DUF6526 family protein [Cyclobacterium xiamenense]SEJ50384.1 hypothetical protein SAMN05192553_104339 [Cyclobacterium xiamenense]
MQNYANHTRYYPLHHYVVTPLTLILLSWSFWNLAEVFAAGGDWLRELYLVLVAAILFLLPVISRIYALKNQNRIIRLEMRLRYFQLTGKPFTHQEKKLTMGQIIALRFASGRELIPLMDRAIGEKLSPRQIKKAIQDWQGDTLRV